MINIIVAVARNGVIGKNGKLPWKLKLDMARFKELTMGNVVIFGLNTFKEFSKPLSGRENIILSKRIQNIEGATVCKSLDDALSVAKTFGKEIFVCGGESVYKEALDIAARLYITHVDDDFDGDRHFPCVPNNFKCVSCQEVLDCGINTTFCVYERI